MAFFRSVPSTAKIDIAASSRPTAFAFSCLSSSSQSSRRNPKPQNLSFLSVSSLPLSYLTCFGLVKNLAQPPSAISMDAPTSDHKPTPQDDAALSELLTEFMVDMKCEGCVKAVKNKLQTVQGTFCSVWIKYEP
uniref:Superoxide dismutase copper chaperone n=1 Tax=Rhizophora mucronata TaxID=61149 RepID=A0A2P2J9L6_RHIMU